MEKSSYQQSIEEYAQAGLYRHYGRLYEKYHVGQLYDQFGHRSDSVRGRLIAGLGAGLLLFVMGITSGEPFIMGMGFLPLSVFGGWLLVRWNESRKARKSQLEILAWFKSKGVRFPYENAAEIIDPLERMDWEDDRQAEKVKRNPTYP